MGRSASFFVMFNFRVSFSWGVPIILELNGSWEDLFQMLFESTRVCRCGVSRLMVLERSTSSQAWGDFCRLCCLGTPVSGEWISWLPYQQILEAHTQMHTHTRYVSWKRKHPPRGCCMHTWNKTTYSFILMMIWWFWHSHSSVVLCRVQKDCLTFSPLIPSEVSALSLKGISYLGNKLDWVVDRQDISVVLRKQANDAASEPPCPLEIVLQSSGESIPLIPGQQY